jgi:hypothetical protein
MQTLKIDERDAAGVLNPQAARWWQQNTDRIPLTSVPFLGSAGENQVATDSAAGDGPSGEPEGG